MKLAFRTKQLWAILAATLAPQTAALAIEMGPNGCLAPPLLMERLKAEGQFSVVIADRVIEETKAGTPKRQIIVFTKNKQSTKGYRFEGDKSTKEMSSIFCLTGEFDQAHALDSDVSKVPFETSRESNLRKVVEFMLTKGFNPMYIGERKGAITVVMGNPSKKDVLNGWLFTGNNDPSRKALDEGGLIDVGYSPFFDGVFLNARSR